MAKTTAKSAKNTTKTKTMAATARIQREVEIPDTYEPIGMWGYFGYQILFGIPVVGWVICISFALMAHNHNLRNFARSQFCIIIIQIILFCVLAACGVLGAVIESLSA